MLRPWHHHDPSIGKGFESLHADVLNFNGHDVQRLTKRLHGRGILQIALHKTVREVTA